MAYQANNRPIFDPPPNVPTDVVFAEQIKVLFVSHAYGAFGAIIAVIFMVIVLWPKVAITPLLSWSVVAMEALFFLICSIFLVWTPAPSSRMRAVFR